MRAALVVLACVSCAGCFGEGLGSSSRSCPDPGDIEAGLQVAIAEPARFVGYCLELRADEVRQERRIAADGVVSFPLEGPLRGYVSAQVAHAGDRYCADQVFASFDYGGTGILYTLAEQNVVCA